MHLLGVCVYVCMCFFSEGVKDGGCRSEELQRKSSKRGNQPVPSKNRSAGGQTRG